MIVNAPRRTLLLKVGDTNHSEFRRNMEVVETRSMDNVKEDDKHKKKTKKASKNDKFKIKGRKGVIDEEDSAEKPTHTLTKEWDECESKTKKRKIKDLKIRKNLEAEASSVSSTKWKKKEKKTKEKNCTEHFQTEAENLILLDDEGNNNLTMELKKSSKKNFKKTYEVEEMIDDREKINAKEKKKTKVGENEEEIRNNHEKRKTEKEKQKDKDRPKVKGKTKNKEIEDSNEDIPISQLISNMFGNKKLSYEENKDIGGTSPQISGKKTLNPGWKRRIWSVEELPKNVLSTVPRIRNDDVLRRETLKNLEKEGKSAEEHGVVPFQYGTYSEEEDKIIWAAVRECCQLKGWTFKEGIEKLLVTDKQKKDKELRSCWELITTCLPNRTYDSLQTRVFRLINDGNWKGLWSKEEEEQLLELVRLHGKKWTLIAEALGRQAETVRHKFKDLGEGEDLVKGSWSHEEMEKLSSLVHAFQRFRAKFFASEKDGRQVRDDIDWATISRLMKRRHVACIWQWYYKLCPFMVQNGEWGDHDDIRLLYALTKSQAEEEEDVEWDNLLPHRSGQTCMRRWRQMKKHLFDVCSSFEEWLSLAIERFAPELLSDGKWEISRREKADVEALFEEFLENSDYPNSSTLEKLKEGK